MLVPKLRFNEFKDEWKKIKLNKIATINPKNEILPNKFIYIDLESVEKGILVYKNIINKENAPSRAQRTVKLNDILFQTVRPYQQNNYFINNIDNIPYVASTGYALLRTNEDSYFLYTLMYREEFLNNVLNMCTGTSFPVINSNDLGTIEINIPAKNEQEKIGKLLKLLDKKIELQKQKIEALKIYKRGLIQKIFNDIKYNNLIKLQDLYDFTYGEGNTNPDNGGIYPIYGANGKIGGFNKYNAEYSVVIGHMGAYAGNVLFEENKHFVTYNGTIAIPKNTEVLKPKFGYYMLLNTNLPRICAGSGMPFLSYETLNNIKVKLPDIKTQEKCEKTLDGIERKIKLEKSKLQNLNKIKKSLLQQMFI